ncbi:hypothetical protein N0V90_006099 [Kalmusia sp. IMI 367209]|nr:hypothetical protein N0V90_006099 [Kalmusia sp. IMI 367209]
MIFSPKGLAHRLAQMFPFKHPAAISALVSSANPHSTNPNPVPWSSTKRPTLPAFEYSQQKPFPFLELPSEIRNIIYDFATEEPLSENDETLTLLSNHPSSDSPRGARMKPPRREFRSLTQVSRQIRKEFWPIYTARNEVFVHVSHAMECIRLIKHCHDSVVNGHGTQPIVAKLMVDINLSSIGKWSVAPVERRQWDIAPLLRLTKTDPFISIKFVCTPSSMISESIRSRMNRNLDTSFNGPEARFLTFLPCVENVYVQPEEGTWALYVRFKQGYLDPLDDRATQLREFVEAMGLRGGVFKVDLIARVDSKSEVSAIYLRSDASPVGMYLGNKVVWHRW